MRIHTIKRVSFTFVLSVLALLLFTALLGGCSSEPKPSDEELITQSISHSFDQIKQQDNELIASICENVSKQENLTQYGISLDEFVRTWLSDFDYRIEKIMVEESEATAVVAIKVKSLNAVIEKWQRTFDTAEDSSSQTDPLTKPSQDTEATKQEPSDKEIGESFMEILTSETPEEQTIELRYTKSDDGNWVIDPGYTDVLNQAFSA